VRVIARWSVSEQRELCFITQSLVSGTRGSVSSRVPTTTMASFTITATAHSRQPDQETNHQQNTTGGVTSTNTPNNLSRSDALTSTPEATCSTSTTTYGGSSGGSSSSSIHSSAPLCTLLAGALPRESEDQMAKRLAAAQARRHRRQAMRNKAQKSTITSSNTTAKSSLEPSALTFTSQPLPMVMQRVRTLALLKLDYKVFAPRLSQKTR
jgi:hypothetical protein